MAQPSSKEVGITPDDNNDRRLPGSVNPEPTVGYPSEFAQPGPLYQADNGGQVGKPELGTDYAFGGITKSASTAGPSGVVETTASGENLSAKFKYPNVSQDVPPLGSPSKTFEDHS